MLRSLAFALSLWIASDTRQHLEIRVTVPADAIELEVAVSCEHTERHSARGLEPGSQPHTETLRFSGLHPDVYTVIAAVQRQSGAIERQTQDVVVTN